MIQAIDMNGITKQQFNTLEDLFSYYNQALFNSQLPFCLINLSRHRGAAGFFIARNWKSQSGEQNHEISINPDTLNRGDEFWHSTLVHEMCHMWQTEFGEPSRYSYHNKEWAAKMVEVGLIPSDTGQPGGKRTGQRMADYVLPDGRFERAFRVIDEDDLKNLRLPYLTNAAALDPSPEIAVEYEENRVNATEAVRARAGIKRKYTCDCGTNVWGKPGLRIRCLDCDSDFTECF